VKGALWKLIGLLIKHYPDLLDEFKVEVQDVLFYNFKKQMKSSKPELKEIIGILNSFDSILFDCRLLTQQSN